MFVILLNLDGPPIIIGLLQMKNVVVVKLGLGFVILMGASYTNLVYMCLRFMIKILLIFTLYYILR